jgi:hypothetical protein
MTGPESALSFHPQLTRYTHTLTNKWLIGTIWLDWLLFP